MVCHAGLAYLKLFRINYSTVLFLSLLVSGRANIRSNKGISFVVDLCNDLLFEGLEA